MTLEEKRAELLRLSQEIADLSDGDEFMTLVVVSIKDDKSWSRFACGTVEKALYMIGRATKHLLSQMPAELRADGVALIEEELLTAMKESENYKS